MQNRRAFLRFGLGMPALLIPKVGLRALDLINVTLDARRSWVDLSGRRALLYTFNGQAPGPILEAVPGGTIRIRLRNGLAETTNLHYHGLHVPPDGIADNSFVRVPPGGEFTYELNLPTDHPGSLFWYHPHVHETTAGQVSKGLAGPLVVRGELDRIPEIAAAAEQFIILQDFDLTSAGIPREPTVMEKMIGREGPLITVNGFVQPVIRIQKDGWLRLRILNACSSRFFRLHLDQHPFYVIGSDGGPSPSPETKDEIVLAPGERVDAMVLGDRPAGNYFLANLPYTRAGAGGMTMGGGMGMGAASSAAVVLATLTYAGRAEQTWRLPDRLVSTGSLIQPSALRTFFLGGGGMTTGGMRPGGGMTFTINGKQFDPNRIDTRVEIGATEDWEFVNPTGMEHPMHLHTNPFRVVNTGGTLQPSWKDVVVVPAGGRKRIRIPFRDFTGTTLYHCHILDHEDLGMMGTLALARPA